MDTRGSIAIQVYRRRKLGLGLLKILAPVSREKVVSSFTLTFLFFLHPESVRKYPDSEGRSQGFQTCFKSEHLWDGRLCKWYRQSSLACTMRLSKAQALPDLTNLDPKIPGRKVLIVELHTAETDMHGLYLISLDLSGQAFCGCYGPRSGSGPERGP